MKDFTKYQLYEIPKELKELQSENAKLKNLTKSQKILSFSAIVILSVLLLYNVNENKKLKYRFKNKQKEIDIQNLKND